MFMTMLEYKLARNGNTLVKVPAQYTSQMCSRCGCVDKRNRRTQDTFKCIACGYTDNADVNAAKNILARGLSSLTTAGTVGSYACGDPSDGATHCVASHGSVKQEAMSIPLKWYRHGGSLLFSAIKYTFFLIEITRCLIEMIHHFPYSKLLQIILQMF